MVDKKVDDVVKRCADLVHNMHTPLATIQLKSKLLDAMLPGLIEAYGLAKERGLVKGDLDEKKLDFMGKKSNSFSDQVCDVNTLLSTFYDDIKLICGRGEE